MMRSSKVKLNITLNRAGLLLIIIYINDVRCRIQQQQHHFGKMSAYHAPPARLVENANKDDDGQISIAPSITDRFTPFQHAYPFHIP